MSTAFGNYLWTFDSTFDDTSSTFDGTPINNASFSNSTINGYGFSLSLNASMNQSVSITQPFLSLVHRSWTFEAWIYLSNVTGGTDYPIIGQCQIMTADRCLHLLVRDRKLHLGFYSDDLPGLTNLTATRWYHAAFVFNNSTGNQSLYLDGVLDATRPSSSSYLGTSGALNIGVNSWSHGNEYFDGLIDQLSFTNRSKTPQEILRDATLTAAFSFDSNSTVDEGPLSINGSLIGNTSFVPGPTWSSSAYRQCERLLLDGARLGSSRNRQSIVFVLHLDQTSGHTEGVDHSHFVLGEWNWLVSADAFTDQHEPTSRSYMEWK